MFKVILNVLLYYFIITATTTCNKATAKINSLYFFDVAKLDSNLRKIRKRRTEKINIQVNVPL